FNIATAHEELGDYQDAITYYDKCVSYDPGYADAWYALACCYDMIDAHALALGAIQQAVELVPEQIEYLQAKADVEYNLSYFAEAVATYLRIIELDPANVMSWYDYASLLQEVNRPNQAIEAYLKVIEIDPMYADAYFELATAYNAVGDTPNTLKALQKAFELDEEKKQLFVEVFPNLYNLKVARNFLGITD
ncbi:MAG: tetratricopeptide repeat protein, partial [Chlorobiales bacterium]|nr:tetratricopeptide repeat protein [Chlorobiales bacterium]